MDIILLLFSFLLILTGVFGDTENLFVKEGQPVTLPLSPEDIKGASSLVWKKMNDKPDIIGTLTLINKYSKVFDTKEKIFGDRLKLNNQTGSLTITNITSQHSGLYDAVIKASTETKKSFNVSVIESGQRSNGEKTGPGLLVVLILMGIFLIN